MIISRKRLEELFNERLDEIEFKKNVHERIDRVSDNLYRGVERLEDSMHERINREVKCLDHKIKTLEKKIEKLTASESVSNMEPESKEEMTYTSVPTLDC